MTPSAIELFSEACGLRGPLRLDILGEDGAPRTRAAFDQPFLVIGRGPNADLALDEENVSTRHCYLQVIAGRVLALDLGSPAGIVVGGVPGRGGWLDGAHPLQIGPVELRLRGGDRVEVPGGEGGESPPSLPLSAEYAREHALPLSPTTLEIVGKKGTSHECRIRRVLTLVGRADACRLRLLDPRVSSYHGALVRTPGGVWLVDLLSHEGIRVSGSRVRVIRLEPEVVCGLGPFTIRLVPDARGIDLASETRVPVQVSPGPLPIAVAPGGRHGAERASQLPVHAQGPWNGVAANALWTQEGPVVGEHGQGRDVVMMLAQMLGAMHRDHMELVRDELTEIRRLAEEMHALRTELHRRPAPPPVAPRRAEGEAGAGAGFERAPDEFQERGAATEGEGVGIDPPARRDPRECLEIASGFLAAYEREQHGYWSRILRLVTRLSGTPDLGADPVRGPVGPAPLA